MGGIGSRPHKLTISNDGSNIITLSDAAFDMLENSQKIASNIENKSETLYEEQQNCKRITITPNETLDSTNSHSTFASSGKFSASNINDANRYIGSFNQMGFVDSTARDEYVVPEQSRSVSSNNSSQQITLSNSSVQSNTMKSKPSDQPLIENKSFDQPVPIESSFSEQTVPLKFDSSDQFQIESKYSDELVSTESKFEQPIPIEPMFSDQSLIESSSSDQPSSIESKISEQTVPIESKTSDQLSQIESLHIPEFLVDSFDRADSIFSKDSHDRVGLSDKVDSDSLVDEHTPISISDPSSYFTNQNDNILNTNPITRSEKENRPDGKSSSSDSRQWTSNVESDMRDGELSHWGITSSSGEPQEADNNHLCSPDDSAARQQLDDGWHHLAREVDQKLEQISTLEDMCQQTLHSVTRALPETASHSVCECAQASLLRCYQEHSDKPLMCMDEAKRFNECVLRSRMAKVTQ